MKKNNKEIPLVVHFLERYKITCFNLCEVFAKKHGYEYSGPIGEYFEINGFSEQYYFNIDEILYDIETEQPIGLIFQWQEDCVENQTKKINFKSYSKGLRFADLPEKTAPEELANLAEKLSTAQKKFEAAVDDFKREFIA